MNRSLKRVTILFAITCASAMVGCKGIDGRVQSSITGEYSDEAEIKAKARQVEAEIIESGQAAQLLVDQANGRLDALYADIAAELMAIGDENIKRNQIIGRGLGISTSLVDMFIPQAKPFTEGLLPLFSDLFLLGGGATGVGVWQRRRGERKGAEVVAGAVQTASDADSLFADAIKSGAAGDSLTRTFNAAPKRIQDAIQSKAVV